MILLSKQYKLKKVLGLITQNHFDKYRKMSYYETKLYRKLTEDVSFEKYLNESFQRLYEYYHKLTDFVEFINQTTNYVDDYSSVHKKLLITIK